MANMPPILMESTGKLSEATHYSLKRTEMKVKAKE